MKRFVLCLSVLFSSVFILVLPETSDAARRDSLEGSELIEDKDDVLIYPQLATDYSNLLSFEYGAGGNTGNALMLYGDDSFAWGFAVHRGDLFGMSGFRGGLVPGGSPGSAPSAAAFDYTPVNAFPYQSSDNLEVNPPQSPLGGAGPFQGNHTFFDVLFGYEQFGGRLSVYSGGNSANPANGSASDEGELGLLARGGYSGRFAGFDVDSALSLIYNTGENNSLQSGTESKGSVFGLGFESRGYNRLNEETSLGALFDLGLSSTSVTQENPDPSQTASQSTFMAQAGLGPVFDVEPEVSQSEAESSEDEESEPSKDGDSFRQRAEIATYAVLGFTSISSDPNDEQDDDNVSASAIVAPGFHLAGEFALTSWLDFRSGAQYSVAHFSTSQETGNGTQEANFDGRQFSWSAGLGFDIGRFDLDGSLNKGFMRAGPEFIGGQGNGLFGSVSAKYSW